MHAPAFDRPLAARPLDSYRYRGHYGWVMIGARNDDEALREASRSSTAPIHPRRLQKWDGERYAPLQS